MNIARQLVLALALVVASGAMAADAPPLAPPDLARITPADGADVDMLTTHEVVKQPGSAKPAMPASIPFVPAPAPTIAPAPAPLKNGLPANLPFGHAESTGPAIPSAPHKSEAVPVVSVDAVESSEPAPPTPVAPDADPVQENPAEPTDLTSPIFVEEQGTLSPRKIVLRALNKVTAQSEIISMKPNDMVKFGQLEITAISCRVSSPTSQTDYAGLLDIHEKLPTKDGMKPLFRGWMYASSPSIAALEHPVYDVTMVECKTMPAAPTKDEKAKDVKDTKPAKATPATDKKSVKKTKN